LPECERAITVADWEIATEREGLAAVVRCDEATLLANLDVRAIVGVCDLEFAVVTQVVKLHRREDRRAGTGGFSTGGTLGRYLWRGSTGLGRIGAPRRALELVQFLLDVRWV